MTATAVVERDIVDLPAPTVRKSRGTLTPMDMLNQAVSQGAGVEVMAQLLSLHERWEAGQARKAFDAALSAAKAEIPVIVKNKTVDFTSAKGRTHYRHEDFAEIARTVDPILARHGLSYRHRPHQEGNKLSVTCILSHRDGHFEESTLSASNDESGNKNSIQAVGSTATYLQRYTLKMALGLAASADDDGRSASAPEELELISVEQRDELLALISETDTDIETFCKYYHIEGVPDVPAKYFAKVKATLEAKKAKRS